MNPPPEAGGEERPRRERSCDLESTGESVPRRGRPSHPPRSDHDWERGVAAPSASRQQSPERMPGRSGSRHSTPRRRERKSPERAGWGQHGSAPRLRQQPPEPALSRRGTPQRAAQALPAQQHRTPQRQHGQSGQRRGWRAGGGNSRGTAAERRLGRAAATLESLLRSVAPPQLAPAEVPQPISSVHANPSPFVPPQMTAQSLPPPASAVQQPPPPLSHLPVPQYQPPPLSCPHRPSRPLTAPAAAPTVGAPLSWQPSPPETSAMGWHGGQLQQPPLAPVSFDTRAAGPFVPPRRALASPTGVEGGAESAEMGGADSPGEGSPRRESEQRRTGGLRMPPRLQMERLRGRGRPAETAVPVATLRRLWHARRAMGIAVEMLADSHSVLRSLASPCRMPHDPLHRCAMAAADLAVVSTRVQPVPAPGTVLDPRLLVVMRAVSASIDSAAAVDIVGGVVSALQLLVGYVAALLEEAGADQVA
ncbi:hypothetical protein CLOM_g15900 [Closterium sp. NIES-68]|nr:hypothetical protein CLOM_g15900 [Closterium sp. NIES-68]